MKVARVKESKNNIRWVCLFATVYLCGFVAVCAEIMCKPVYTLSLSLEKKHDQTSHHQSMFSIGFCFAFALLKGSCKQRTWRDHQELLLKIAVRVCEFVCTWKLPWDFFFRGGGGDAWFVVAAWRRRFRSFGAWPASARFRTRRCRTRPGRPPRTLPRPRTSCTGAGRTLEKEKKIRREKEFFFFEKNIKKHKQHNHKK